MFLPQPNSGGWPEPDRFVEFNRCHEPRGRFGGRFCNGKKGSKGRIVTMKDRVGVGRGYVPKLGNLARIVGRTLATRAVHAMF